MLLTALRYLDGFVAGDEPSFASAYIFEGLRGEFQARGENCELFELTLCLSGDDRFVKCPVGLKKTLWALLGAETRDYPWEDLGARMFRRKLLRRTAMHNDVMTLEVA